MKRWERRLDRRYAQGFQDGLRYPVPDPCLPEGWMRWDSRAYRLGWLAGRASLAEVDQ